MLLLWGLGREFILKGLLNVVSLLSRRIAVLVRVWRRSSSSMITSLKVLRIVDDKSFFTILTRNLNLLIILVVFIIFFTKMSFKFSKAVLPFCILFVLVVHSVFNNKGMSEQFWRFPPFVLSN